MATLALRPVAPAAVTNLAILAGVQTVTLTWDAPFFNYTYQVWSSATNNSNTATLLKAVESNAYTPTGITSGSSPYYWVRAVNEFGILGEFGSSVQATLGKVTSADTTTSGVTTGSNTVTNSNVTSAVTNYGTWYPQNYTEFTASANTIVSTFLHLVYTISSVTSTSGQTAYFWGRARLYDVTAGADVPGGIMQHLLFRTAGATTYGNLSDIYNGGGVYITGFRGLMQPGHTYRIYLDLMKEQFFGTPTFNVNINGSGINQTSVGVLS